MYVQLTLGADVVGQSAGFFIVAGFVWGFGFVVSEKPQELTAGFFSRRGVKYGRPKIQKKTLPAFCQRLAPKMNAGRLAIAHICTLFDFRYKYKAIVSIIGTKKPKKLNGHSSGN
ncbi:MAG TPA: hypothetical protein PK198_07825 [Saprospiraceae bacterium]|nr:hypothetical protein [Saprospiraceae bacterium]